MGMSAKRIGEVLGLNAREVNLLLKEKGFLSGKPGDWILTELGKQFGKVIPRDNGWGGWAKRTWNIMMWDEEIVDQLKEK